MSNMTENLLPRIGDTIVVPNKFVSPEESTLLTVGRCIAFSTDGRSFTVKDAADGELLEIDIDDYLNNRQTALPYPYVSRQSTSDGVMHIHEMRVNPAFENYVQARIAEALAEHGIEVDGD